MFPKCCWMRIASWYCPLFTAPILMNHTQNQSPIAWCTHKTNHPHNQTTIWWITHKFNRPFHELPQNSILKTSDLQRVEIDTMSILFFHFLQWGNLLQMPKHFQKQEANNFMTELKELSTNNQLNGSMAKFHEQKEKEKETKKIN